MLSEACGESGVRPCPVSWTERGSKLLIEIGES